MTDSTTPPVVSVIIPVHNGERFLAECLNSVLAQTLEHLEVIVVDDASTDGTPQMLEEYAVVHRNRLRVVTRRQPTGVSGARNAGLAAARGRYVAFVDADDVVSTTMYADLVRVAKNLSADIVSCGIRVVDYEGRTLGQDAYPLPPETRVERAEMRERLHHAFTTRVVWFPFRSVYSRALLVNRSLQFDEGVRKGEDSLFNFQALHWADGCAAVTAAHYAYRKHPASATAKALASESENLSRLGQALLSFYAANGYQKSAYDDFFRHVLRSDLPTALLRLREAPGLEVQAKAILATETVQLAFATQSIFRLGAPLRVVVLLALCKYGLVGLVLWLLRASGRG